MTTTIHCAATTEIDKRPKHPRPIRFVARTIRFIVMTVIVQRSDARDKLLFKRKSTRRKANFHHADEAVDKNPVQITLPGYPRGFAKNPKGRTRCSI